MNEKILFLAHVDESGNALPKIAFEALGAALALSQQLNSPLEIGLIGESVQSSADSLASAGAAHIFGVQGPDFAKPRFSSDAAAAEALCRASTPQLVIAPATSRFFRALPCLAQRLTAQVDTHITSINVTDGAVAATRWFYRQRIEGSFQRQTRPWILLLDSGCHEPWHAAPAPVTFQELAVALPPEAKRTSVIGIRAPKSDSQTIRPDANLLFVAGAGWTKNKLMAKPILSKPKLSS